ncbi:alpha-ketoglutarate-dependent dioxygenase AlkB [Caulobacter sp. SLTY]|uniref:alpha-ketoglutarate-dependent dioxygenase AlkB n=1 Tax=Caulobacter sp. SLTY TaxID=2683262 RepID=UPI0014135199|nr:alpha-ketoglutarate-dependent dioxygenase AlkB [Caulobacter sp. SLTY]NBB15096.1 alpha-ketoglutarate-dependent dioxygenase AlkB [Caulobacter sp. SLTY]
MSVPSGFQLLPAALDAPAQQALVVRVMAALEVAPAEQYRVPRGGRMSVAMSGFGALGWASDTRGYRYSPVHPGTGNPWPAIPDVLLALWARLADPAVPPDSCLINLYRGEAKMGLHQDRDEADFRFPVLSVSLGDTAVFRIGGTSRGGRTASVRLASGDVCLLAGEARLAFHGVDRILAGSSTLVPGGGRINLTLRRAAPA